MAILVILGLAAACRVESRLAGATPLTCPLPQRDAPAIQPRSRRFIALRSSPRRGCDDAARTVQAVRVLTRSASCPCMKLMDFRARFRPWACRETGDEEIGDPFRSVLGVACVMIAVHRSVADPFRPLPDRTGGLAIPPSANMSSTIAFDTRQFGSIALERMNCRSFTEAFGGRRLVSQQIPLDADLAGTSTTFSMMKKRRSHLERWQLRRCLMSGHRLSAVAARQRTARPQDMSPPSGSPFFRALAEARAEGQQISPSLLDGGASGMDDALPHLLALR